MSVSSRATPLYMVQMQFSEKAIHRSAKKQGIPGNADDLGYVLHGHLQALFGELAPKPFLGTARRGRINVLAYAIADRDTLAEKMRLVAEPAEYRSVHGLATKSMPTHWTPGRRLGFEVSVCPIVRDRNQERDAYPPKRKIGGEGVAEPTREQVYGDWLAHRLEGAAKIEQCRIDHFGVGTLFRRHQARHEGRRRHQIPRLPIAKLTGELEIEDGDTFAQKLCRGIGRHRAFGFGLLLIRAAPPVGAHR